MSAAPVCLTLIAARSLRDDLFDFLSEQSDLVSGFTASEAAGHGVDVRLETTAERVKGHADEILVRLVLPQDSASRLLERLRTSFAGTRLVYWMMPVIAYGRLDEQKR